MLFGKKAPPEAREQAASKVPDAEAASVTESLYKQNLELAVKNKTLLILGKLYEISIQTLAPKELSQEIATTIQHDFEYERVGIITYDPITDTSSALAYAESERFHTARAVANEFFENGLLKDASKHPFFGPVITDHFMNTTQELEHVWGWGLKPEAIKKIQEEGHARAMIAYPLLTGDQVIGIFVLTLNRAYTDLGEYEKESIKSFTNVISVALDKARLYEELTVSNQKLEEANGRLKQVDQLKSEFLSVASHQLRAPITAIKGYVANIAEDTYGEVPEYLDQPLEVINESVRIMISSIEDYLNVSRIEQGRMKYEFGPVEITSLAKRATDELIPIAQKKGLVLSFTDAPAITIEADFGKIKQVFTNLIDNAIKYTEQGSVTVSMVQQGEMVRFMTSDTGIGIPADEINKLFEKFTRARDANKVNTTGTGLGLYVAKSLVEGHGGTIHVESDGLGKGSRFIVELPLKQATHPNQSAESPNAAANTDGASALSAK